MQQMSHAFPIEKKNFLAQVYGCMFLMSLRHLYFVRDESLKNQHPATSRAGQHLTLVFNPFIACTPLALSKRHWTNALFHFYSLHYESTTLPFPGLVIKPTPGASLTVATYFSLGVASFKSIHLYGSLSFILLNVGQLLSSSSLSALIVLFDHRPPSVIMYPDLSHLRFSTRLTMSPTLIPSSHEVKAPCSLFRFCSCRRNKYFSCGTCRYW